jgi:hypothetical protein
MVSSHHVEIVVGSTERANGQIRQACIRVDSNLHTLSENQHHIILDIFFSTSHLEPVRLSIHKPSFNSIEFKNQPEFLRLAICTLAAVYLGRETSVAQFDGDSPFQFQSGWFYEPDKLRKILLIRHGVRYCHFK